GPMILTAIGKVAFGKNDAEVFITGATRITNEQTLAQVVSLDRGVLAQPSNVGVHHFDAYTVVPEGELNVGYDFNEHVRLSFGYSFLYWNKVLRPANQIDQALNIQPLQPLPFAGEPRPAGIFRTSPFFAQGLTLSCLLSY